MEPIDGSVDFFDFIFDLVELNFIVVNEIIDSNLNFLDFSIKLLSIFLDVLNFKIKLLKNDFISIKL
jgi:hypothetical protein